MGVVNDFVLYHYHAMIMVTTECNNCRVVLPYCLVIIGYNNVFFMIPCLQRASNFSLDLSWLREQKWFFDFKNTL